MYKEDRQRIVGHYFNGSDKLIDILLRIILRKLNENYFIYKCGGK